MKVLKEIKAVATYVIFATLTLNITILTSCSTDDNITLNTETIEGKGEIVTHTLSVDYFAGINLATILNVTLKQGATQEVKAIGQSNIIDKIRTDVTDNVWKIELEEGSYSNFELSIEVTVPNINKLIASSSGSIVVNNFANQNALTLETSSAGSITINEFEGITHLEAVLSAVGNIVANKDITTLQNLTVNISSASNFNGFLISSDDCVVTTSSSGIAKVTANNTLNATISSSGIVYYKGNPTIIQNITSSGQLIDAN